MKFGISIISTAKQDHQKQIEYLLSKEVPKENIIVVTESGKTRGNSIIKTLKEKNIQSGDEVVFESFDRLGRNLVLTFEVIDWLETNNVNIIIDGKKLDRTTESGETQTLIEATVAELYRIRRSHQSKNIIARDKANGTYRGGRPSIHPKKVEHIKELSAKCMKPTEISIKTGVNRSTVYKYI